MFLLKQREERFLNLLTLLILSSFKSLLKICNWLSLFAAAKMILFGKILMEVSGENVKEQQREFKVNSAKISRLNSSSYENK